MLLPSDLLEKVRTHKTEKLSYSLYRPGDQGPGKETEVSACGSFPAGDPSPEIIKRHETLVSPGIEEMEAGEPVECS